MTGTEWEIPTSTLRWLSEVPYSSSAVVLLRHSVRDELPLDGSAYVLPITEAGTMLARQLGAIIGARLRTVHTSPLTRCVQTAEALCQGAGVELLITENKHLGDPGVFVIDGNQAWSNWAEMTNEEVVDHIVSKDSLLPGMADPDPAARLLVSHMLAVADGRAGLHVFVTHDALVMPTAARLLGEKLGKDAWPGFLEGAFFWQNEGRLMTAYRDQSRSSDAAKLTQLSNRDVIDFARREIENILGSKIEARFFMAGGAFKTLLTGCLPRDIDLWAPTIGDREDLITVLTERGAIHLETLSYSDAFEIGGRVVEISHSVANVDEALAGFDIALSAIAVEHRPHSEWHTFVHPMARESVEKRQVLLIKPLVNWKHSLASLERMRRYAIELDYEAPAQEEAEIWRVFDSQPEDMKQGMLERFKRTSKGGQGVLEEVYTRLSI